MKIQFYILKKAARILTFLMICVGFSQANAQSFAYFSNDTDFVIPDNGGFVNSTIVISGVPGNAHLYNIDFGAKINHSWVGDLVMAMEMPSAQKLGLMHRPGTVAVTGTPAGNPANISSDNFVFFRDTAASESELMGNGLTTSQTIMEGEYKPSWNNGEFTPYFTSFKMVAQSYFGAINGNWMVAIKDVANGDAGVLSFVDLSLSYDQYCVPFVRNTLEHITNVSFSGLNYSSGRSGTSHPDFHTVALGHGSTPVKQGQTYPISVTISAVDKEYVYAFIDWNQDGNFEGTNEVYVIATNVATAGPHILNITVPEAAMLGETRLRVALERDFSTPSACFSGDGEIEDFTLLVEEKLGVDDLMTNQKTTAHPNPIINEVNFTSKNTISQIEIYNASGQKVMTQNAKAKVLKLNLSALIKGVYVAKIKTDKGLESLKLIKK